MLLRYTLEVTGVEPEALGKALTIDIDPQFSEVFMTGAEKLRQEGHERGLLDGQRAFLARQLRLRFGPLPDSVAALVETAEVAELERFDERVLTANSLDEVLTKR